MRAVLLLVLAGVAACGSTRREKGEERSEPWWTAARELPAAAPEPPPERVVKVQHGHSIWYGDRWHGARTASGERMDQNAMTAAHRSLPMGTRVRVTNLANGRQVIVRINDRGPYGSDRRRIIDVTKAAARELGFLEQGSTRVKLEVLGDRLPAASD